MYSAIHGHALRHGPPELYQLNSAIHYTAIQRYTLYNLYNTPLVFTSQIDIALRLFLFLFVNPLGSSVEGSRAPARPRRVQAAARAWLATSAAQGARLRGGAGGRRGGRGLRGTLHYPLTHLQSWPTRDAPTPHTSAHAQRAAGAGPGAGHGGQRQRPRGCRSRCRAAIWRTAEPYKGACGPVLIGLT